MRQMFLSIILLASLDKGTVFVEHPELSFRVPAIFGKPSTPTPTGIYTLSRAYSTKLKMNMLVFRKEGNSVWAIHPNLDSRRPQIESTTGKDNYLSAGCIGIKQADFDKLWAQKQAMLLQVY